MKKPAPRKRPVAPKKKQKPMASAYGMNTAAAMKKKKPMGSKATSVAKKAMKRPTGRGR